jgi:hypothetical protein
VTNTLAEYVAQIVDNAPPFTVEQRENLMAAFASVGGEPR